MSNVELIYFIFNKQKILETDAETIFLLAETSVKKFNKEKNASIHFSNEQVFIFNTYAFEQIAEFVESDENVLKVEERLYNTFKYSLQELQRFFYSLITSLDKTPKLYSIPKEIKFENINIKAVGIDLGTSRCCVAVNRINGIETVGIENVGGRLLPSYVSYDEKKIKCGQIVVDRLRRFSKCSVCDIKRFIGKDLAFITVDRIWPFKLLNNSENKMVIRLDTSDGEMTLTTEEVTSALLQHLKMKTEEFQGKKLTDVVITVPATFTRRQKEATSIAAKLAGWDVVHLLPEPIAASFAYFIDKLISDNSIILLFDLGGGALDVCIFKIVNYQIEIITNCGDSKLGGRDFDNLLMDYF
uniref:Heat shock protein 70 n=1 Tax=Panagrolaimus sp. ES5 TaxID=591445 RepID=A0AC34G4T2_9BILA